LSLSIAGIGIVFTRGRGIDSYDDALRQGWIPPSQIELPYVPDKPFLVYQIEKETLTDRSILKRIRRADRFSKMAVLAAFDAVHDSGITREDEISSLGIITATALGPHTTTFRFLDDILDYGDVNVSPTLFSHSVHNAATSYIASVLNSHGPTVTLTHFFFSFHQALILAEAWLNEGRCKHVLVGSVDECGAVMEYICSRKLRTAQDGRIKPFNFSPFPLAVPGEGSVFFLITRGECRKRYCEITGVYMGTNNIEEDRPDMYVIDANGLTEDEIKYKDTLIPNALVAGYAPVFGSIMTGSSFNCAAAALMLKNQVQYACPVQDNPFGVNLCAMTEHAQIEEIQCIKNSCDQKKAVIKLKRS